VKQKQQQQQKNSPMMVFWTFLLNGSTKE